MADSEEGTGLRDNEAVADEGETADHADETLLQDTPVDEFDSSGNEDEPKQLTPEQIAEKVTEIQALLSTIEEKFYPMVAEHESWDAAGLSNRGVKKPEAKEILKGKRLQELEKSQGLAMRLTAIYRAIGSSTRVKVSNFRYKNWSRHRPLKPVITLRGTGIDLCKKEKRISWVEGFGSTHGDSRKLEQVIEQAEGLVAKLPSVDAIATERKGRVARVLRSLHLGQ